METEAVPISESTISIKERSSAEPCTRRITRSQTKKKSQPSQSYILTGSDSEQIHEENLNKMKSMSEAEILEEREKLVATTDPAIIAFLKSRRRKEVIENRNPTIEEQNTDDEYYNGEIIDNSLEEFLRPIADDWLNFDTVEASKLSWMKDVPIAKYIKAKDFEARYFSIRSENCLKY